jgi:hypothetical protein
MLAISITLGIVYFIGVIVSFFKIYKHLSRSQQQKQDDELDPLIALGGSVFWPLWILPYAVYRFAK